MSRLKEQIKKIKFIENSYIKYNRRKVIKRMSLYGNELLNEANKALEQTGVEYFLDFGTLLGFIREGGFIEHDPDIDISVIYFEGVEEIIDQALTKNGFKKYLEYKKSGMIVEEAYVYKGVKMDVFYLFEDKENGGKLSYHSFITEKIEYNEPYNKSTYTFVHSPFLGTKQLDNQNVSFRIPINEYDWIEERYGQNWRIPVKEWSMDSAYSLLKKPIVTYDGQQIVYKI